jgi:CxxC-x17-CxxC domain-containing protein
MKKFSPRKSDSKHTGRRPSFGPSSSRPAFGGGFNRGNRQDDRREVVQKFDAVCSACGKACQVPFRPNGKKPVYCKDCFDSPRHDVPMGGKSFPSSRSSELGSASTGGKSIADLTRQIAAMNAKIDTMLEIIQGEGGE